MKKILFSLLVLCLLGLAAVYYFIPSTLNITDSIEADCTVEGGFRTLSQYQQWSKWWPGEMSSTPMVNRADGFVYKGDSFYISKVSHNNFNISIKRPQMLLSSELNIIPLPNNAMGINWHSSFAAGSNPFKRYMNYKEAVTLKENMRSILKAIKIYLSKKENLYGLPINEESTKDSILLTYKTTTSTYPNTAFVYSIINNLKNVSKAGGANVTGSPMLNITPETPVLYKVRVALPINKVLPDTKDYFISKLIPGKFITAEVKGGDSTINEALKNIQLYFLDYKRITMAIPFQYLVTDRSVETDSTKWFTKIYAPVY
jgi:hypothetical protein